jgi:epoxyqueuosine reductase
MNLRQQRRWRKSIERFQSSSVGQQQGANSRAETSHFMGEKKRLSMKDDALLEQVHSNLEEEGWQSRAVSIAHLHDLRERIEEPHARGLLNEEFYQERLTHFSFEPPQILPNAKSLFVVAVPQPQVRVLFTWHGRPKQVIIPPTYDSQADKLVEDLLSHALGPEGYHVARAILPVKSLAVLSGLGEYGKNNICYVPRFGSFHRLVSFYSDITCPHHTWREPQAMRSCENCQACSRACPTRAIASDHFLVRAERCITFHNERPGEFPTWIDPSWHNCLEGCMHCQRVCPENADFRDWVEGDHAFSEEETDLILRSTPPDRLPRQTARKLAQLSLLEDTHILGRNLKALLERQG